MFSIEAKGEAILQSALFMGASDVHFVPRERDAVLQLRIDRGLFEKEILTKDYCTKLISHFKFLAGMDIGETRKPQNGSLIIRFIHTTISLRLSTLPTIFQESLVIRILPQKFSISLPHLSLFPKSVDTLTSLLHTSSGLVILTGPTGSGKTTTLYSMIRVAKEKFNKNIITLEEPIEQQSEGVLQVEINERAGITYSAGLKAILRHDPDIIMVGEIRDEETAKIAIRAAYTGHLVLTTMHTKDSKGALYRLKEFGIPISDIKQTILAVGAQRLVELICPFCNNLCSPYCRKNRLHRRLSIYELLHGTDLKEVIKELQGYPADYRYVTLSQLMKKGYLLGFLGDDQLLDGVNDDRA